MAEQKSSKRADNFKDITGQRFGRLTALRLDLSRGGKTSYWICCCDCGVEKSVNRNSIRAGSTRSCGCLNREKSRPTVTTHGRRYTREYKSLHAAKQRCFNTRNPDYAYYGGRGITVCKEWTESFEAFYEHIGPCPPGYTLDRIDNDGNYEPGNVRWATRLTQGQNRRNVKHS